MSTTDMVYDDLDSKFATDLDVLTSQFYAKYEPKEILGRGLCSVVRKCVDKNTKESYAVKIIDLTRKDNKEALLARDSGYNEINLLKTCSKHPYIIQLHEAFETPAFLFLIFELCPNGELFDFMTRKVRLSEKRTRVIMKQLLEAVAFLHSQNIMHRDIKCENILFDNDMNIRLSDFGFSAFLQENAHFKDLLGTPGYLSPEMLNASMYANVEGYGLQIDMWACGVVMYSMIAGTPPFYHRKQMMMLRSIRTGKYHFPSPEWDEVSSECIDLIKRMLDINPSRRITAKEALVHPFFTTKRAPDVILHNARRKLKALMYLVRFICSLQRMVRTSKPLSLCLLATNPYAHKSIRKLVDSSAFTIYGHWVKKTDEQNRGALFERRPKSHLDSHRRRYRLLSGTIDS